jgi:hypothetical protein
LDAGKVSQRIYRAVYQLKGLEDDLRKPTRMFVKRSLDMSKAKLGYRAINTYLIDNADLMHLADSKDIKKLPPELQADAVWIDGLMTQLQGLDPRMDRAWVLAKKGLDGQEEKILRLCKSVVKEVRTPPKGLQKMVQQWVRGVFPPDDAKPILALLPFVITSWAIADQVDEAMVKRPR